MREPYTQLHLHLVWATWDRQPIILPEWKEAISGCIHAECVALKAAVIAQHIMPEHVHLLVRFPTTVTVAVLAKQVKGVTSHFMTHQVAPEAWFKWQGGYGAFAVSKQDIPRVQQYIHGQEEHHSLKTYGQEIDELDSGLGD